VSTSGVFFFLNLLLNMSGPNFTTVAIIMSVVLSIYLLSTFKKDDNTSGGSGGSGGSTVVIGADGIVKLK